MWLFFLSLHLVGLVGYSLLLRKSLVNKVDRWTLATIMQTGVAVPILFALAINPPILGEYTSGNLALILLAASLVIGLHLTNVKALQYLEASVYSVLYNLRIIFTTVLGVLFLAEDIVPLQIAGGLLIFLGVIVVRQKGSQKLHARGVQWGVAAAVVISVLNLCEKQLIGDIGFMAYAAPVMLIAAAVMWAILLGRKQPVDFALFKQPRMIQLMVLRAISAYGFILAFNAGGLLSVSSYISSMSVILIVLLGIWLLGERDYLRQKLTATGLAVLGLTAILLANL